MSNSGRSGKAGKIRGSISAWIWVATFSSAPMRSFSAVMAEMWAMMPKDRILFETDAPFRLDEAHYGDLVQDNLRRLAEIAGEAPEALAAQLVRNAENFLATGN